MQHVENFVIKSKNTFNKIIEVILLIMTINIALRQSYPVILNFKMLSHFIANLLLCWK